MLDHDDDTGIDDEAPITPEGKPAFAVVDEATAAWALDRILAADERAARIEATAAAWAKRARDTANRTRERFGDELAQWARGQLAGKRKTVDLPTGAVSFRSVKGGLRVVDKERALAFAVEHGLAVDEKIVRTVAKAALDAHVEACGEIPDGCDLVDDRETVTFRGAK